MRPTTVSNRLGRVFAAIKRIIECSPLLRAEARITADKITIAGAVTTAIPSNYASAAGSNQVVATFDELWAYNKRAPASAFRRIGAAAHAADRLPLDSHLCRIRRRE